MGPIHTSLSIQEMPQENWDSPTASSCTILVLPILSSNTCSRSGEFCISLHGDEANASMVRHHTRSMEVLDKGKGGWASLLAHPYEMFFFLSGKGPVESQQKYKGETKGSRSAFLQVV